MKFNYLQRCGQIIKLKATAKLIAMPKDLLNGSKTKHF